LILLVQDQTKTAACERIRRERIPRNPHYSSVCTLKLSQRSGRRLFEASKDHRAQKWLLQFVMLSVAPLSNQAMFHATAFSFILPSPVDARLTPRIESEIVQEKHVEHVAHAMLWPQESICLYSSASLPHRIATTRSARPVTISGRLACRRRLWRVCDNNGGFSFAIAASTP
jgi:hypothetical protein